MNKLWRVFGFELKRQSSRRAYLFMTFGIPLLAVALLFGYQAIQQLNAASGGTGGEGASAEETSSEEPDFGVIGYVDHSGLFPDPGLFGLTLVRYDSEEDTLAAMDAGELTTVYVIAEDYLETGKVTRYLETFSLEGASADGFFSAFLRRELAGGADQRVVARIQSNPVVVEHVLNGGSDFSVAQSEDVSFLLVYLFALLLAFAAFFSSGYLMQSVIEEKETRIVEILLSSVRPVPLLAGKVLSMGLLGLLQIAVWVATTVFILSRIGGIFPALAGLHIQTEMLVWMVPYFLLGYLMFAGVYAAIGALAPSMREGPQLAVFITLPAMIPFYFLNIFVETPNGPLPTIFSLFPITSPLAMVQRLAITTVPLHELLISLALLALTALGAIWLAGRLFRVNTLLAGQMPKWRDLLHIVREA